MHEILIRAKFCEHQVQLLDGGLVCVSKQKKSNKFLCPYNSYIEAQEKGCTMCDRYEERI